ERDFWITVLRNADHVVAELLGERLGHDDILPGQPSRLATFDVTCSCIRPMPVSWGIEVGGGLIGGVIILACRCRSEELV
ncbi:hypothetical protein, partial [Leucobacter sp. 7(1)]|uniref:hypothetical protein n=1 Tax=Leucobacter sp. 7(1) TaxID=1255613 RepID=UPI001C3E1961